MPNYNYNELKLQIILNFIQNYITTKKYRRSLKNVREYPQKLYRFYSKYTLLYGVSRRWCKPPLVAQKHLYRMKRKILPKTVDVRE